jgi:hypothetical protein
MSNSEQEALKQHTEDLDHAIKMGEAWKRLQRNADFKTIITKGYLHEKVLASVSLLAVPQIKQSGQRPEVMEDLVASSNLQFFFKMIESAYEGATAPILTDEEQAAFDQMQIDEEGAH